MKNIFKYLGAALSIASLTMIFTSCSPESFDAPNGNIPVVADYADAIKIEVDQETNYATFTFEGAKGVMPVWIVDGKSYSTAFTMSKYYRKAGEYNVEVKIANANGVSDGTITKTFTIEKTKMSGFGGFVYDSDFNLWTKATIETPTFWYAPGWAQIADPTYTIEDGTYNVTLPEATTDTWQGQMMLPTNISTTAASNYDFSLILTSNTDHPHVMVKLVDAADDNIFYCAETVALTANEPVCFWKSDMAGLDIASLKLVLDFGGNAANTTVSIENIVIKDHANDDGTVVPETPSTPDPAWVAVDSPENLWHGVSFTNFFYYAPGWAQLPNPALTVDGANYSLSFPAATSDQWQNQVVFISEALATSAADEYDFKVTITATNEIKDVTVKLAQNDNDDVYVFLERKTIGAGESVDIKAIKQPGVDITQGKLVFDFGGNPANTDVVISNVILQKHKD